MLFTGEFEHAIDDKQRVAVPAEIRARLDPERHGAAFYVVLGPNGALWLWPERTFEAMAEALAPTLLPSEDLMDFEELFFSQAARLELDGSGRVRLPERLVRAASIGSTVAILGVRDHLELRDAAAWNARRDARLATQGEIMLRARAALADATKQRREGAS